MEKEKKMHVNDADGFQFYIKWAGVWFEVYLKRSWVLLGAAAEGAAPDVVP